MPLLFKAFIEKLASSFRRIAYRSGVETVGDLHGEAWIIANEISEKRGRAINFADEADQQLVIARLYVLKVMRRDRQLLHAVQIDQDNETENGPSRLIDRLAAPLSTDPLVHLLLREEEKRRATTIAASYSQAAAYLQTFNRFGQDRERVCDHLCITANTLFKRIVVAAATYHCQDSLFDGKVKIGSRFTPQAGRRYVENIRKPSISSQWGWDFEDQPGVGRVVKVAS